MTILLGKFKESEGQKPGLVFPHGCQGGWEYGTIYDHRTFTPDLEEVIVKAIPGFICFNCGLVALNPKTSDSLYAAIAGVLRKRGQL